MGWSANLDLPPGEEVNIFQHMLIFFQNVVAIAVKLFLIGKHLYKFIIEGSWIHDPTRPTETDPEGNVNNVVTVDEHGVVGEEEEGGEGEEEEEQQQQRCQYVQCTFIHYRTGS